MSSDRVATVAELQADGILRVEDGNHGEYRPRPDEFVEAGTSFIRAADLDDGRVQFDFASRINDVARRRITKGIGAPGDILLSHKGTVGKVALVAEDAPAFVCSPQTTFWRTLRTDVLDRGYLYAFLRSRAFMDQLAARMSETDMAPYVSLTAQRTLRVHLPPIEEQRRVAGALTAFDERIELDRRLIRTLRDAALATGTQAIRGDPVALGSIADLQRGFGYRSEGLADQGTSMISMGTAERRGWLKRSGLRHYDEPVRSKYHVGPWDLLVVNVDLTWKLDVLGWPLIVPSDLTDAVVSNDIYVIRLRADNVWKRSLVWAALQTSEARAWLEGVAKGTTVASVSAADVLMVPIAVGDSPQSRLLAASTEATIERAWTAELEAENLARVRDALLPRLLGGAVALAS